MPMPVPGLVLLHHMCERCDCAAASSSYLGGWSSTWCNISNKAYVVLMQVSGAVKECASSPAGSPILMPDAHLRSNLAPSSSAEASEHASAPAEVRRTLF